MLKAAITGNIGSGKTTVCKIFESLHVPVFYADAEAKALYRLPEVIAAVKATFGKEMFDRQNRLRRQKLAGQVFHDPHALKTLNNIIHPKLMEKYGLWLQQHANAPYTLHEAAVIFENHLEKHFDIVINVSCPEEIRLERIRKRDNLSVEEIKNRMARQWDEQRKNKLADVVIVNDGRHFLIPQVLQIHDKLQNKNT